MSLYKQSVIILASAVILINLGFGSVFLLSQGSENELNNKPLASNVLASLGALPAKPGLPTIIMQGVNLVKTAAPCALSGKDILKYEVQLYDNPSVIAARFGITTETILSVNNLEYGDYIFPGDKIDILPVSGTIHKVNSGDTLDKIAQKYKVPIQDIIDFNELDPQADLASGLVLIIPGAYVDIATKPTIINKPKIDNYFINPATGYISQHLHPTNAIDVANDCGTPIYAAASGTVSRIKWGDRAGYYILIDHTNGTKTLYAHLSKMLVRTGDWVKQGQKIALMGTTGHSTGCHLHFSVYNAQNPLVKYQKGDWVK